jgi:hypothetical protein
MNPNSDELNPALSFRHLWNDRISLDSVADYCFGANLPKPCFHPLRTAAGPGITGFEMSDHVWHRGLWFTIKFINQTNFWEENAPFGSQISRAEPHCQWIAADTLRMTHGLEWTSLATGPVIHERRDITFQIRGDGVRVIDWVTSLDPLQDLLLDRTPYTTWGGYGGLTFRAAREVHDSNYLLPDGQTTSAIIGQSHPWVVFRGQVDGGAARKISLGMIDHPSNPRSPSPWYCKSGQSYDFMNAAFLFHEPMRAAKGRVLEFRYRVLYRDGWWEPADFAAIAEEFRATGA